MINVERRSSPNDNLYPAAAEMTDFDEIQKPAARISDS
jgi:hypothetical protein